MIRLFVGMIVGAMAAIVAADGPATADRILVNASQFVDPTAGQPDVLLHGGRWIRTLCVIAVCMETPTATGQNLSLFFPPSIGSSRVSWGRPPRITRENPVSNHCHDSHGVARGSQDP